MVSVRPEAFGGGCEWSCSTSQELLTANHRYAIFASETATVCAKNAPEKLRSKSARDGADAEFENASCCAARAILLHAGPAEFKSTVAVLLDSGVGPGYSSIRAVKAALHPGAADFVALLFRALRVPSGNEHFFLCVHRISLKQARTVRVQAPASQAMTSRPDASIALIRPLVQVRFCSDAVSAIAWSPSERQCVLVARGSTICSWDIPVLRQLVDSRRRRGEKCENAAAAGGGGGGGTAILKKHYLGETEGESDGQATAPLMGLRWTLQFEQLRLPSAAALGATESSGDAARGFAQGVTSCRRGEGRFLFVKHVCDSVWAVGLRQSGGTRTKSATPARSTTPVAAFFNAPKVSGLPWVDGISPWSWSDNRGGPALLFWCRREPRTCFAACDVHWGQLLFSSRLLLRFALPTAGHFAVCASTLLWLPKAGTGRESSGNRRSESGEGVKIGYSNSDARASSGKARGRGGDSCSTHFAQVHNSAPHDAKYEEEVVPSILITHLCLEKGLSSESYSFFDVSGEQQEHALNERISDITGSATGSAIVGVILRFSWGANGVPKASLNSVEVAGATAVRAVEPLAGASDCFVVQLIGTGSDTTMQMIHGSECRCFEESTGSGASGDEKSCGAARGAASDASTSTATPSVVSGSNATSRTGPVSLEPAVETCAETRLKHPMETFEARIEQCVQRSVLSALQMKAVCSTEVLGTLSERLAAISVSLAQLELCVRALGAAPSPVAAAGPRLAPSAAPHRISARDRSPPRTISLAIPLAPGSAMSDINQRLAALRHSPQLAVAAAEAAHFAPPSTTSAPSRRVPSPSLFSLMRFALLRRETALFEKAVILALNLDCAADAKPQKAPFASHLMWVLAQLRQPLVWQRLAIDVGAELLAVIAVVVMAVLNSPAPLSLAQACSWLVFLTGELARQRRTRTVLPAPPIHAAMLSAVRNSVREMLAAMEERGVAGAARRDLAGQAQTAAPLVPAAGAPPPPAAAAAPPPAAAVAAAAVFREVYEHLRTVSRTLDAVARLNGGSGEAFIGARIAASATAASCCAVTGAGADPARRADADVATAAGPGAVNRPLRF